MSFVTPDKSRSSAQTSRSIALDAPEFSGTTAFVDWLAEDMAETFKASLANAAGCLKVSGQVADLANQAHLLPRIKSILRDVEQLALDATRKSGCKFDELALSQRLLTANEPASVFAGPMAKDMSRFLDRRIKARLAGISKGDAALLQFLLRNAGSFSSKEVLKIATRSRSRNAAVVKVRISRLRTVLLKSGFLDPIKTGPGGYMISKNDALRLCAIFGSGKLRP